MFKNFILLCLFSLSTLSAGIKVPVSDLIFKDRLWFYKESNSPFTGTAFKISNETGIPHEIDHIVPICKGGLHHPDNLQILTMKENRSKGGK